MADVLPSLRAAAVVPVPSEPSGLVPPIAAGAPSLWEVKPGGGGGGGGGTGAAAATSKHPVPPLNFGAGLHTDTTDAATIASSATAGASTATAPSSASRPPEGTSKSARRRSTRASTSSTSKALTARPSSKSSSGDRGAAASGFSTPITPAQALRGHVQHLSQYEQGEILEFKQVYCLGAECKAKAKASTRAPNNHGFDDERGDYTIIMRDHLAYRYEIMEPLGKGSFGQVVKCFDHKTGQYVAVKVIRNKKRFHHQALVEVKLLTQLRDRDATDAANIIHIKESFYFRHHLCISFPLLSINLYEFVKNNNFQGVSLGLIRRFAIQLLTSLRFLRSQRIVHCDLKPENILLKQSNKSGIKVIDFGSSCLENERVYTYIQSRFYRSPEVILGLPYGMPIDMWSFGCILAELLGGYPLFPGENEVEQLACIMEVMGPPPADMVEASTRKKHFFDPDGTPRIVANSRGRKRRPGSKDLATVLRCGDGNFVSFLAGCLHWDPAKRFTPDVAFQHPWIMEASVPVPRSRARGTASRTSLGSTNSYRSAQIRNGRRRHHGSSHHGHRHVHAPGSTASTSRHRRSSTKSKPPPSSAKSTASPRSAKASSTRGPASTSAVKSSVVLPSLMAGGDALAAKPSAGMPAASSMFGIMAGGSAAGAGGGSGVAAGGRTKRKTDVLPPDGLTGRYY